MQEILVVSDCILLREGIQSILQGTPEIRVGGEVASGKQVLRRIREKHFSLILMDLSTPDRSALDLIRVVRKEFESLPILVFCMSFQEQYALRTLRFGVRGYLGKGSSSGEMIEAIRRCISGRMYIPADVAEQLVAMCQPEDNQPLHRRLSDREFQVFELLIQGIRVSAIANQLCISVKTASTHKKNILKKLQIGNMAQLVHYAVQHQLSSCKAHVASVE